MTVIREEDVITSVADALQYISYFHPMDYIRALGRAYELEESPAAKDAKSAREKAAAQKRLEAIQAKLLAGESFAAVADQFSDLPSKNPGWELDWIEDADLGKEEGVEVLRVLSVGGRTEPIKTRRGMEIFTLIEKEDGRPQTLEECRGKLAEQINQEYRRVATRKRVDDLARRYGASMNLDAFLDAAKKATVAPTSKLQGSKSGFDPATP